MVLETTPGSPLDSKEIKPVKPKGDQSCIFIGRTDAEAEAPVLWPPYGNNGHTGKDPDAGEGLKAGGEGMIEDVMVGWQHRLNRHEFEQALGDFEGQRSLVG